MVGTGSVKAGALKGQSCTTKILEQTTLKTHWLIYYETKPTLMSEKQIKQN